MYKSIPLDQITIPATHRALHEPNVLELIDSISQIGLQAPIIVAMLDEGFGLVAGLHRLTACRRLGYGNIEARIIAKSELNELITLDENLVRYDGTALEKSLSVARRQALYEQLYPTTRAGVAGAMARHGDIGHGGIGQGDERNYANDTVTVASPQSFAKNTAQLTGTSERTIQRYAKRGRVLSERPYLVDAITSMSDVADSHGAIDALIALDEDDAVMVLTCVRDVQAGALAGARTVGAWADAYHVLQGGKHSQYTHRLLRLTSGNSDKAHIINAMSANVLDEVLANGGFHYGDEESEWLDVAGADTVAIAQALEARARSGRIIAMQAQGRKSKAQLYDEIRAIVQAHPDDDMEIGRLVRGLVGGDGGN